MDTSLISRSFKHSFASCHEFSFLSFRAVSLLLLPTSSSLSVPVQFDTWIKNPIQNPQPFLRRSPEIRMPLIENACFGSGQGRTRWMHNGARCAAKAASGARQARPVGVPIDDAATLPRALGQPRCGDRFAEGTEPGAPGQDQRQGEAEA